MHRLGVTNASVRCVLYQAASGSFIFRAQGVAPSPLSSKLPSEPPGRPLEIAPLATERLAWPASRQAPARVQTQGASPAKCACVNCLGGLVPTGLRLRAENVVTAQGEAVFRVFYLKLQEGRGLNACRPRQLA